MKHSKAGRNHLGSLRLPGASATAEKKSLKTAGTARLWLASQLAGISGSRAAVFDRSKKSGSPRCPANPVFTTNVSRFLFALAAEALSGLAEAGMWIRSDRVASSACVVCAGKVLGLVHVPLAMAQHSSTAIGNRPTRGML